MCNDPLMDALFLALAAGILGGVGSFCYFMVTRRMKESKMEELV